MCGLLFTMNKSIEIFPWNTNFETGIVSIDEQHKVIVSLINQLASQLVYQPDADILDKTFTQLAEYAAYHFQSEEKIWQKHLSGTSYLASHHKTHESFLLSISELKHKDASTPVQTVIEDILTFLTKWLALHVLKDDMRLSKIILALEKGVSFDKAEQIAEEDMSGAMQVLLEATLSMYENLCKRTIDLQREIIERKGMERQLRLASSVFDNTLEGICITDTKSIIVDANDAFFKVTGYEQDKVIGKHISDIKSGLKEQKLLANIWEELNVNKQWRGEIKSRNKNGELQSEWLALSTIKNDQNEVINFIGIFSNISSLIQNQIQLEYIAHHDALTKLPNRMLLADRLEQAIDQANRKKQQFAVCFLDLDGFKPVNDNYGHAVGDKLLCEVSNRIKQVVRGNDTVARVGGDEFVTIFNELNSIEDCGELLNRLMTEISEPIVIDQNTHHVSASIGVALFPKDSNEPDTLLHLADTAMYEAKRQGKARYHFYT